MQNVLIIGNGFDIFHKLPTRYTDFIFLAKKWDKFYHDFCRKEEASERKETENRQFVVRVDDRGKLTENALQDFVNNHLALDFDRIKRLDEILSSNIWVKYFIEIGYEKENWIDFEAEIENVLVQIEKFYSPEMEKGEDQLISYALEPDCYKVISFLMDCGLIPVNRGFYTQEYVRQILYGKTKEPLLDRLKEYLNALIEALNIYIDEFVSNIKVSVFSEDIKEIGKTNILNFNYTNTYKNVYGSLVEGAHHQIHGSCQNNDMVLGISDNAFDNTEYVFSQKYFQRIQKRTGSYYRRWIPKVRSALDDEPIEVYIMGHSLGETDKGILNEFFLNKQDVKKITIYYHNQDSYEKLVIALIVLYGKDFVIEQTGDERIVFAKLRDPVSC